MRLQGSSYESREGKVTFKLGLINMISQDSRMGKACKAKGTTKAGELEIANSLFVKCQPTSLMCLECRSLEVKKKRNRRSKPGMKGSRQKINDLECLAQECFLKFVQGFMT